MAECAWYNLTEWAEREMARDCSDGNEASGKPPLPAVVRCVRRQKAELVWMINSNSWPLGRVWCEKGEVTESQPVERMEQGRPFQATSLGLPHR